MSEILISSPTLPASRFRRRAARCGNEASRGHEGMVLGTARAREAQRGLVAMQATAPLYLVQPARRDGAEQGDEAKEGADPERKAEARVAVACAKEVVHRLG